MNTECQNRFHEMTVSMPDLSLTLWTNHRWVYSAQF